MGTFRGGKGGPMEMFFGPDEIDSEDEDDILEEFMMQHSQQVIT